MSEAVAVAFISSGLTLVGVVISNAMTRSASEARQDEKMKALDRRMDDLTGEVRLHNNYARRMPVVEEQIKVVNHRLKDLEGSVKHEQ